MIATGHLMKQDYMKKISAKKRIMFVQHNDFNFLSYVILLTLEKLSCFNEKTAFIDYRKVAFISNILFYKVNKDWDKIYYDSQGTVKNIELIIQSLNKKGIIEIKLNSQRKTVDIWLLDRGLSKMFVNEPMFIDDLKEIEEIKKNDSRIRTSKLSTFLEKQFSPNGVKIWEA